MMPDLLRGGIPGGAEIMAAIEEYFEKAAATGFLHKEQTKLQCMSNERRVQTLCKCFCKCKTCLPGPKENSIVSSTTPVATDKSATIGIRPMPLLTAGRNEPKEIKSVLRNCEPIVEEPATPQPETAEVEVSDIEDAFYEDPNEIPAIKHNLEEFTLNLHNYVQENMELQEGDMSKALVALNPQAASIPTPKLKNVSRLRTEHQVFDHRNTVQKTTAVNSSNERPKNTKPSWYELPDSHPLLIGLDKRGPDDPSLYLLVIWTPGETANSVQLPEGRCGSQESGKLCNEKTCFSCNSMREANAHTVRGTILIPCRTAIRGSFQLNGTYFQVNEMFVDHESSLNPIDVPRAWIWNLPRHTVYFGTSVSTIFKAEWELSEELPDEDVMVVEVRPPWTMYFDGASHRSGAGAGVVFVSPEGDVLPYAFTLTQNCSNNEAEYQALILGLEMAVEAKHLQLKADALAKLASTLAFPDQETHVPICRSWVVPPIFDDEDNGEREVNVVSVLEIETEDWRQPLIDYLQHGKLPDDPHRRADVKHNARLRLEELEALDEKRLEAQQRLECYQARMSKSFNKKVRLRSFQKGDLVLAVRRPINTTHKIGGKFISKWDGPYVVQEVYSSGAYKVVAEDGLRVGPINGKFLKRYYP
ncbi:hypothetical protein RHSIM_Rhsim02G0128300 [Rhododendron simsii]|uniref:RNase H type-1 domain-containing protein n=1 Tax=Rhododendron simsii TaxID=118357 RepID=A0A834LS27_RHOSS|nr:hypothetical protein RHSIM_Rhsim02G0128300 [Rhododendron simsii]